MSESIDHDRGTPGNAYDQELSTPQAMPTTETCQVVVPDRNPDRDCDHTRAQHSAMAEARATEVMHLAARYMTDVNLDPGYPEWLLAAVADWSVRDVAVAAQMAVAVMGIAGQSLNHYLPRLEEAGYPDVSEVLMAFSTGVAVIPIMGDIVAERIRTMCNCMVATIIAVIAIASRHAGWDAEIVRGFRTEWTS